MTSLANWIMDIVLDLNLYKSQYLGILFENLNKVITLSLLSKRHSSLGFAIGTRDFGATRIQIIDTQETVSVYPTIFHLSSGEASLLCLFGELLRQADNCKKDSQLSEISGIVLIDEVDKHLHIKLQKEALPKLFKLFPNIQFIVSSHSPFLSMGLAEEVQDRARIFDLDNLGISKDPTTHPLYVEVYNMMLDEDRRFKDIYQELKQEIKKSMVPLVITEGKTDIIHIRKAQEALNINDLQVEYFEIPEQGWGSPKLKALLENLCKVNNRRKIIGVFDRDEKHILSDIEINGKTWKKYGNNVYAFCIPIPRGREQYKNISIEFYYADSEIKKKKDGKCLYFDNELNFDSSRKPRSCISQPEDSVEKKIWDENIGNVNWIHSKTRFAELVEKDADFTSNFNFDNFNLIFTRMREIINAE